MNVNVWSIKDMFSVPPGAGGAHKTWNAASSDHSSLTDSQFLFSSQFCPENSQPGSIDYKSQTNYQKTSNPNSQESDPSLYHKYQSRPPLCCAESKEKIPFQTFGKLKNKSIIEQFEESKKKAKEKYESERFQQLICQVHVTVQELKMTLCHVEENTNLKCKSILDSMDATSKALQENLASYQDSVHRAVSAKCSCTQLLLDLENKILLKDAEVTDLKSNVQLLMTSMDALRSQQCAKHLELSEKLTWLSDCIKSSEDKMLSEIHNLHDVVKPAHCLKENTTQTSPTSLHNLSNAEQHLTSQLTSQLPSQLTSQLTSQLPSQLPSQLTSQLTSPSACLDGSTVTHSSAHNTCDRIRNGLSSQHRENLCLTRLNGVTTHRAQSEIYHIASDSPESYLASNAGGQPVRFSKGLAMEDKAAKSVCGLQQFDHNDQHVPAAQKLQHNKKENRLSVRGSKEKSRNPRKANKRRENSKSRKYFAIKNTTQVISKAAADHSQDTSKNEPVTHKRGHSVRQKANCFTLYSDRCEPSLPVVIPGLVRKTQKKNCLKGSTLSTEQTITPREEKEASDCHMDTEDSDLSIWDSKPLSANSMIWAPLSSASLSTTNPSIHKKQQDLISLFFDSSDDSH